MGIAISKAWDTVRGAIAGAIVMWVIVVVATSCVAAFLMAWILYAENEIIWAIGISVVLSLITTTMQIVSWYRAQPPPRNWLTVLKAWKEPIIGVAMHYPGILGGTSIGALALLGRDAENGVNETHIAIVLVQQIVLTGTTWLMFGERLRKRIPPGQANQPAGQPSQPVGERLRKRIPPGQANQPAGARKEDKQMSVALALLALLAIAQVLLALLSVVTVLAFFVNTKKGKRRRRK